MFTDPQNPFVYSSQVQYGILEDASKFIIRQFQSLMSESYDASDKSENTIRDDLVRGAKRLKKETPTPGLFYKFDTESPDLEERSRIDISLVTPSSLYDEGDSDITLECKIVGEQKYINRNGLNSFISGKYAGSSELGGMVGFIKTGDIVRKVDNIKRKLTDHDTIVTVRNLERKSIDPTFNECYESEHERPERDNITIRHLFFDFTPNIST